MITDLEQTRNEIGDLTSIDDTRYENIFKMAKQDKYFFYNISKKVNFPSDIDPEVFTEIMLTSPMPWTSFANEVYGDQNLWWLICSINKIQNPTNNPVPGKTYKVIKPTYVNRVLVEINNQLL